MQTFPLEKELEKIEGSFFNNYVGYDEVLGLGLILMQKSLDVTISRTEQ